MIYADLAEMVFEDELSHHRMLVNQTKAKKDAVEKKEAKEDAGDESEDKTDGEPDDTSTAGEEEEELESQQGAPEISEEQ